MGFGKDLEEILKKHNEQLTDLVPGYAESKTENSRKKKFFDYNNWGFKRHCSNSSNKGSYKPNKPS